MNEPVVSACEDNEFYAGYLPAPPGYARVIKRTLHALSWLAIGTALIYSSFEGSPGDAVWNTAEAQEFVGVLADKPYPLIRVPTGDVSHPFETLLLVEVGKFGGGQRAAAFAGRCARISGWVLRRDGRRILEMEPGVDPASAEDAVSPAQKPALAAPPLQELGPVVLRGEIIDSKCFLGAMKPGQGKTHKECATLCISGGIPPMFVTLDDSGRRNYYLLTSPDGGPVGRGILPYVADAVEIRGRAARLGDLTLLMISPDAISRL